MNRFDQRLHSFKYSIRTKIECIFQLQTIAYCFIHYCFDFKPKKTLINSSGRYIQFNIKMIFAVSLFEAQLFDV